MKTKMNLSLIIVSAISIAMLVGCDKNETLDPIQGAQPIKLATYLRDGDQVIPLGVNTRAATEETLEKGYYLTGIYTWTNFQGTLPSGQWRGSKTFDNVLISKDGTYSGEPRLWGTNLNSFFAYSNTTGISNFVPFGNGVYATAYITFAQSPDPSKQLDPLVAEPVYDLRPGTYISPTVNLYFRHATTRIVTKIYFTGGVSDIYNAKPSITYNALNFTGELPIPFGEGETQSLSNPISSTYALSAEQNIPSSAKSEGTAVTLGDINIIPQELTEGWATLSLSYKPTPTAYSPETVQVRLPAMGTVQPGIRYTLYVQLMLSSASLSVSGVTLTEWSDDSYTVDKL